MGRNAPRQAEIAADAVLPQLLPAGTDGLVRRARRAGLAGGHLPVGTGKKADPFASAPAGIRPEWYFLAPFYTLKLIPSHVWVLEGELLGSRIRSAGAVLGDAAVLGHEPTTE